MSLLVDLEEDWTQLNAGMGPDYDFSCIGIFPSATVLRQLGCSPLSDLECLGLANSTEPPTALRQFELQVVGTEYDYDAVAWSLSVSPIAWATYRTRNYVSPVKPKGQTKIRPLVWWGAPTPVGQNSALWRNLQIQGVTVKETTK